MREVPAGEIEEALAHYRREGWARLPEVCGPDALAAMRARFEDICTGRVVYPGMFFQPDAPTGRYTDLAFGEGWTGPDTNYRKVEKLELDPLFCAWLNNPVFRSLVHTLIPGAVSIYRAVVFAKAARVGSDLPWHQDAGRFWGLDRDPQIQLWTALDDAPVEAGCLEFVNGTHHRGLASPLGGVVPQVCADAADAEAHVTQVPARAGDVVLIHNYVWHRSGANRSEHPRRGFTVCYMDASTRCTRRKRAPRSFVRVFE